jgi:hypothetical protein
MVETISSAKLARKLNQVGGTMLVHVCPLVAAHSHLLYLVASRQALENAGRQEPLEVMVQVNTSDEESPSLCQLPMSHHPPGPRSASCSFFLFLRVRKGDCTSKSSLSTFPEKNGVPPEEAFELCSIVRDECSRLKLKGLMTIGMLGRKLADGETNPDFEVGDDAHAEFLAYRCPHHVILTLHMMPILSSLRIPVHIMSF